MEELHRKKVKHFHLPGDFHELTFSCYKTKRLLTRQDFLSRLARHTDEAISTACFDLVAFVYMPEHLHLLVFPRHKQADISRFLAKLKKDFSGDIKSLLSARHDPLLQELTVRERFGKSCFRFWQEGSGYDRNLRSPEAIRASIDYIHMNPVRAGLCDRATDWKWSSARYYLLEPPCQQFPDLPRVHGLPGNIFN